MNNLILVIYIGIVIIVGLLIFLIVGKKCPKVEKECPKVEKECPTEPPILLTSGPVNRCDWYDPACLLCEGVCDIAETSANSGCELGGDAAVAANSVAAASCYTAAGVFKHLRKKCDDSFPKGFDPVSTCKKPVYEKAKSCRKLCYKV
jgi:hypothetical protein